MGVFGIIWILAFHYIGDFLLQSREMAQNKSKSAKHLSEHVAIYSMIMTILFMLVSTNTIASDPLEWFSNVGKFLTITYLTHWVTDYITSRWTSRLWKKKEEWKFFAVIGFDQLIHISTLLLTYEYLLS